MKKRLLLLSLGLVASATVSQAAIYIVDFVNSGTTDIPNANTIDPITSGTNQNITFIGDTNFTDTTGGSSLTIGSFAASASGGGNVITVLRDSGNGVDSSTLPSWATESSVQSAPTALGPSGQTTTLTFSVSGFSPNETGIDVSFISTYLNNAGGGNLWAMTVNGVTSGDSASFNGYTNGYSNGTSTIIPFADLDWSGLTADASGAIDFSISTTDRRIALNAMQITTVPEPSTYVMILGFLALGGCLIRRRMRD